MDVTARTWRAMPARHEAHIESSHVIARPSKLCGGRAPQGLGPDPSHAPADLWVRGHAEAAPGDGEQLAAELGPGARGEGRGLAMGLRARCADRRTCTAGPCECSRCLIAAATRLR